MHKDETEAALAVILKMTFSLQAAADALMAEKPRDAIGPLTSLGEVAISLANIVVKAQMRDTGKTREELCGCPTCVQVVKEKKERDARKATSSDN